MQQTAQKYSGSTYLIFFTLWLIATLLNINKAFHIDDTFHLEAARWIEQHPLQPMSGKVNWESTSNPLYHYNQPPLYFYLIAFVGSLLGYNEIVLHLFQSLFTLIAIVSFYKIAEIACPKYATFLSVLLVLNPAFLVNQNLMVDVPLLSLQLLFMYILIKPGVKSGVIRYGLAAVVISITLLIKYTTLPLVMLLLLAPFVRKEPKYFVLGLIPLFVLGLWSIFNYLEFGAIHLLGRPKSIHSFQSYGLKAVSFILCLGSIAPFTIVFVSGVSREYQRIIKTFIVLAVYIFISIIVLWYVNFLSDEFTSYIFLVGFMTNGLLAVVLAMGRKLMLNIPLRDVRENKIQVLFLLWGVGLGVFLLLYAPFMATRHVLLILPPILLLCADLLKNVTFGMQALAVSVSLGLSLLLGVSDWTSADFYRKQAKEITKVLPENATVWAIGHWGWQWYSKEAGMKQYDYASSEVAENDYIVAPKRVPKQPINNKLQIEKVKTIVPAVNFLTYFSTAGSFASFYYSDHVLSPWSLTKVPVDTINVFRVIEAK